MDKIEHGARLRAAMARRGMEREDLRDAVGKNVRTITNWRNGQTMPDDSDRQKLRDLFPGYDDPGDGVEVAILGSELTEDRKYMLIGRYKQLLREQAEGSTQAV